jgi:hypothetical protein
MMQEIERNKMGKGYTGKVLAEEIRKIVSELILESSQRSQIASNGDCHSSGSHCRQ